MYAPHRTVQHQVKACTALTKKNSRIRPRPKHKSRVVFLCLKWVEYVVLVRYAVCVCRVSGIGFQMVGRVEDDQLMKYIRTWTC